MQPLEYASGHGLEPVCRQDRLNDAVNLSRGEGGISASNGGRERVDQERLQLDLQARLVHHPFAKAGIGQQGAG